MYQQQVHSLKLTQNKTSAQCSAHSATHAQYQRAAHLVICNHSWHGAHSTMYACSWHRVCCSIYACSWQRVRCTSMLAHGIMHRARFTLTHSIVHSTLCTVSTTFPPSQHDMHMKCPADTATLAVFYPFNISTACARNAIAMCGICKTIPPPF